MTHIETKKQLVPKLRFKDYGGEWKKTKIGQILKIGSGKDYKHLDTGIIPVFGTGGLMTKVNKPLFSGETVFIGRKGSIDKPFYFNGDFWTVDTLFYTYNFHSSIPKFVYCLFQKINWYVHNEASGVPSLSKKTIESIQINIPSLPEQQKIASFLSAVDEKIQLLTRKKELLENYKKGVMQQLFSGKLRFKDADGKDFPDWEEKRLGEIMSMRNEQAPKSEQYPLMAFIQNIGVAPKGDRYNREFLVNDGDGKKYKKTEYGDFIYSSNNLETGSIGLNRYGSASISPVYSIFQIKKLCDYQFISSFLLRKRFINKMIRFRQGVVYGQWRIHESDFLKIQEKIPCIEEQQKIASFLSAIDEKVEAVNQQITQSQTFKKGLLQQMFV